MKDLLFIQRFVCNVERYVNKIKRAVSKVARERAVGWLIKNEYLYKIVIKLYSPALFL